MITKMLTTMARFSAVKYEILNGQYLVPPAPKRSPSSYLLFSLEARKDLKTQGEKGNIVAESKAMGAEWKTLPAEKKEVYEKKAKQLKQAYDKQKAAYDAKYVIPFKTVTANQLIQRQFYSKNKFASLVEGVKAFGQFKASLKQEDLGKYQKAAEEINKNNDKIKQYYEIPTSKFKDFNSYLRFARKSDPSIPEKSKIDPSLLAKLEANYQEEEKKSQQRIKEFAASFHLRLEDLIKLINKQKTDDQKLDEEGRKLKERHNQLKKGAEELLRKQKQQLASEKKKAKKKVQRLANKQIKDLEKKVEQQKKVVARIGLKFTPKLKQIQRQKLEHQLEKKAEKQLAKKKDTAGSDASTGTPAEEKPKGRPKAVKKQEPAPLP